MAPSAEQARHAENVFHIALRGGSTRFKITWVQQRQHYRAQESSRERMLSLPSRRIFDVCKREPTPVSHAFVKENLVRYVRPHGRFAHCSCENVALPTKSFGLKFFPNHYDLFLNLYPSQSESIRVNPKKISISFDANR